MKSGLGKEGGENSWGVVVVVEGRWWGVLVRWGVGREICIYFPVIRWTNTDKFTFSAISLYINVQYAFLAVVWRRSCVRCSGSNPPLGSPLLLSVVCEVV